MEIGLNKYKYEILEGMVSVKGLTSNSLIRLYDTTGRIIMSKNVEAESSMFRLPNKGVYIINISSDNKIENKKIIW